MAGVALTLAQGAGLAACKGTADRPPSTTLAVLSADEVCRRVPAEAVTAALGEGWPRADDTVGRCRYQSAFKKTATLTIGGTALPAEQWRRQAEAAGGTVTDHDGALVADYAGDGFGPLDEVFWVDGTGAGLILRVDGGVTLDQALSLVSLARHGVPRDIGAPNTTASNGAATSNGATPTSPAPG